MRTQEINNSNMCIEYPVNCVNTISVEWTNVRKLPSYRIPTLLGTKYKFKTKHQFKKNRNKYYPFKLSYLKILPFQILSILKINPRAYSFTLQKFIFQNGILKKCSHFLFFLVVCFEFFSCYRQSFSIIIVDYQNVTKVPC